MIKRSLNLCTGLGKKRGGPQIIWNACYGEDFAKVSIKPSIGDRYPQRDDW